MAEVKVYYDKQGETLTVWFGDPSTAGVSEEAGDDIILLKDKNGAVIGLEKLNFVPSDALPSIQVEAAVA